MAKSTTHQGHNKTQLTEMNRLLEEIKQQNEKLIWEIISAKGIFQNNQTRLDAIENKIVSNDQSVLVEIKNLRSTFIHSQNQLNLVQHGATQRVNKLKSKIAEYQVVENTTEDTKGKKYARIAFWVVFGLFFALLLLMFFMPKLSSMPLLAMATAILLIFMGAAYFWLMYQNIHRSNGSNGGFRTPWVFGFPGILMLVLGTAVLIFVLFLPEFMKPSIP